MGEETRKLAAATPRHFHLRKLYNIIISMVFMVSVIACRMVIAW
jgi:hypothetical protein